YSGVAGATLPSAAVATAYWTTTLSMSLIIVAILSPILGTLADVMRGKKKMLSIFVGIGVVGTGLLVVISTGDWILASAFFIVGRVGFAGANVFYDSLLPHVARPEDQDSVSARGYAIGYLGGGLLLAVNVAMILFIGSELGARLSFVTVAVWWAVFSIPIFRRVPEPPSATKDLLPGRSVTMASFARLGETLQNIRRYKELFKYLIAFLIYNDGIGTIISVAVIYGAELGFQDTELILAILLVQFVGIPFSLIFGKIPRSGDSNRAVYLAFIVFNIVALPLAGIIGAKVLAADTVGAPPPVFTAIGAAVGEGSYGIDSGSLTLPGTWTTIPQTDVAEATQGITNVAGGLAPVILGIGILALLATWALARRRAVVPPGTTRWGLIGLGASGVLALLIAALAQLVVLTGADPISYSTNSDPGATYGFEYNGQVVDVTYSTGPDHGSWTVAVDGQPVLDDDEPLVVDGYSETLRYGVRTQIDAGTPGVHTLQVTSVMPASTAGGLLSIGQVEVLPGVRKSSLTTILAALLVIEVIGLALSVLFGKSWFGRLATTMTTKRSIILALIAYAIVAVWGFFLDAVIEFWFLAWMVAVVQGGSQALSRSLYASMSPTSVSGEFFGFFSVMSKFSAILGPVLFAGAVAVFGSSRPAVLSLVVFFIVGIVLLNNVDVEEGRATAQQADRELMGGEPD
ncbi:MAG: MFS transporter, partial [Acidimicrobiia bacterium]|nr:MFS transporter [Acidimicrobiia bacterium]